MDKVGSGGHAGGGAGAGRAVFLTSDKELCVSDGTKAVSAISAEYFAVTPYKVTNYSNFATSCFRIGNVVFLQFAIIRSKATNITADTALLATVPASCRPKSDRTMYRMCECIGDKTYTRGVKVTTSGQVQFLNIGGSTPGVITQVVNCAYPIDI